MPFEIRITRVFSAAHQLRFPGGGVEPLHGHDWRTRVTVAADTLDELGCVMDFHEFERLLEEILRPMANVLLNDLPAFTTVNPSAENVAQHIGRSVAEGLPAGVRLVRAAVTEAPGCVAAYVPAVATATKPMIHAPYFVG